MALTELQLPAKTEFYRNLQNAASEMYQSLQRWQMIANFVATVDSADLDAMGVAAGQVRTDLTNFRIVVNYFLTLYENGAVTPAVNPTTVIDKIRRMW